MASPSIQSNQANLGAGGSGTCAFPGAQTAGHTNVIAVWSQTNHSSGDVSIPTDSSGNTYALAAFQNAFSGSGGSSLWLFVCVGIASHGTGNVVSIAWTGGTFTDAIIVEYPATGAVRTSNGNNRLGGGTAAISTTLSSTVTGDLVVMTSWANNVAVSGAGTVGANAANVVQADTDGWVVQDGLSDGSSPMTVVCGAVVDDTWTIAAISFLPSGGPTISVQPSSIQVPGGGTASFGVTATPSGGGALTYQWKLAGVNVTTGTGGTTSSYTTGPLPYSADLGQYTCAVTETGGTSDGTTTTSAATVNVGTIIVGANTPVFSSSGGTTIAPSYSTLPAIVAGDEILLVVAQKPSAANSGTVTTPAGYTLLSSLTGAGGYAATLGSGTGDTNLFVYRKTGGAIGSETGTFTVTVGTNNVAGATLVLLRPVLGTIIGYAAATGSDTTAGNVSVTVGSDPKEVPGDVAVLMFNGASSLATYSAEAVTTTGVTYATVKVLASPASTTGNSIGGFIASAKASSGLSSAAPVFTATTGGTTTNARGPGIYLRMRVDASPSVDNWNYQRATDTGSPRAAVIVRSDVVAPLASTSPPAAWAADWNFQRSSAPIKAARTDVQLPTPAIASGLIAWHSDRNDQRAQPPAARGQQDQALPQIGVHWAADWQFARLQSAPASVSRGDALPAVNVLSTWASDGNLTRQSAGPLRVAQDVQLPAVRVLSPWSADGNPTRAQPAPSRVTHDVQPPAVSVLPTWAAEGNAVRAQPAPSRSTQDVQLPTVFVLPTWAPEGSPQRALAGPLRVAPDAPLPPATVLSTWAAEGNGQVTNRGPSRVAHDVQIPAVLVLSTWAPEGNTARQLPGPAREAHETPFPSFAPPLLLTWIADGNRPRSLPGPQRVSHDVQQPKANALSTWMPDAPTSRQQPAPSVVRVDAPPLPGAINSTLAKASPEWNHQRALPTAQRAAQDQIVFATSAARPVADWYYPRAIPGPRVAAQDAVVPGSSVLDYAAEWNFQRPSSAPGRVTVDGNVARSSVVAPFVQDWRFNRLATPPSVIPATTSIALPSFRPPAAWAADWNFQRSPIGIWSTYAIGAMSFAFPDVAFNNPGCAHGTVTAIYSASGSMFLTASASGLISPLASATSKITGCT